MKHLSLMKHHSYLPLLGAAAWGLLAAAQAAAQTFFIQPTSEAASKDSKIYISVPDSNFQSDLSLISPDITFFSSLLQFDLSSLAAVNSANVVSAYITLYCTGVGISSEGGGGTITMAPILGSWREDAGSLGTAPIATYNNVFGNRAGTIPIGSVVASQNVTGEGFYQFDITNLAKSWIANPSSNNGVFFRLSTTEGDVGIADSDSSPDIAGSSPSFTVNVNPVPEPTAGLLLGLSSIGLLARRRRPCPALARS